MKTNRRLLILFTSALFLLLSSSVQAETTDCTPIPSLPYAITNQGIYCLTSDLSTNIASPFSSAITISVNNVVIDLNGHKLGGLPAGAGTGAIGIFANQQKNITIRNGTIRGFYIGIWFEDTAPFTTSQGHLIEDIRADMNTYIGIDIWGQGNIIRNNQVVSTTGSTGQTDAYGILVSGPGARILNNDVVGTVEQAGGSAYGICLRAAPGASVEDNRIGNPAPGPGTSYGIFVSSSGSSPSTDVLVSNNRVTTITNGVSYDTGCTGKYRDNLTSGVTNSYTGTGPSVIDAGNNN